MYSVLSVEGCAPTPTTRLISLIRTYPCHSGSMTPSTFGGQVDLQRMCDEVAESLRRIYRRDPDPSYLIFPEKRFEIRRISEQESKILFTQWLQRASLPYSIETPTMKTFMLTGVTPQSALTDVTVYSNEGALTRVLNIELKAGQPGMESFRKDLEKLLQEQVPGMWFHTLEKATPSSWKSLHRKIEQAFVRLEEVFDEGVSTASHSTYFYFCVLTEQATGQAPIPPFNVNFSRWREDLDRGFASVES